MTTYRVPVRKCIVCGQRMLNCWNRNSSGEFIHPRCDVNYKKHTKLTTFLARRVDFVIKEKRIEKEKYSERVERIGRRYSTAIGAKYGNKN